MIRGIEPLCDMRQRVGDGFPRLLWGEGDRFLGTPLIEPTAVCDSIESSVSQTTPWLPHEQPEVVVNHMVRFFDGTADSASGQSS